MNVVCYTSYPPASFASGGGALAIWYGVEAISKLPGVDLTIIHPCGTNSPTSVESPCPSARLIAIDDPATLPRLLGELSPQVFHTMRSESLPALSFCKAQGIPTLYEVRSPACYPCKWIHKLKPPYHRQWREMLYGRLDRRAARLASYVIVPSRTALGNLTKHYNVRNDQSGFFYNGIDFGTFKPAVGRRGDPMAPVIVNAGRLAPDRHFDLLLRVFSRLKMHLPGARLEIAGDGSERRTLEQMCAREGIRNVTFHGILTHRELAALYRSADLLLNSSESESFGNVVAEAMACGLPVVCFKAGSLVELVEDGVTGRLCRLLDEDDLFNTALRLLTDEPTRQRMGLEASRSAAERFSWKRRAEDIVRLYSNLIAHPSPRGARA